MVAPEATNAKFRRTPQARLCYNGDMEQARAVTRMLFRFWLASSHTGVCARPTKNRAASRRPVGLFSGYRLFFNLALTISAAPSYSCRGRCSTMKTKA